MRKVSSELLRIKSNLYPWIVADLLEQMRFGGLLESPRPIVIPEKGFYSRVGDTAVVLDSSLGKPSFVSKPDKAALVAGGRVGFSFKDAQSSVDFYENGKPILSAFRSVGRVFDWVRLLKGILYLQNQMSIKGWESCSDDALLYKVKVTLCAAIAGLNGLAVLDPFSAKLLKEIPDGIIRISIGFDGPSFVNVRIEDGHLMWDSQTDLDEGKQTVDMVFKDLKTAWKSVANLADNLAAVGKGDILIRGFVPLADGFNHMLDRLQIFVKSG